MALAPRRRRGRRPRWLFFAVLATAVVLLVNAAFSSPDNPSRRLARLAYLDAVRPQIDLSTSTGASVASARSDAVSLGRAGTTRLMTRAVRDAEAVVTVVRRAKPPDGLSTAHSILVATVAIRARVARTLADGLAAALTAGPPEPAVDLLVKAGEEMVAADQAYKVFVDAVPAVSGEPGPALPVSAWADDPALWTRPELTAFVTSIRSSTTLTAVHDVGVLTVVTDPVPVATEGNSSVLPLVKSLRLDVVVADTGNAAEKAVPVVATIVGPAGEVDTARNFVDLAPGQRRTVSLGGLHPQPGGPTTLTVVIGPVEGEMAIPDNERSLSLILRG